MEKENFETEGKMEKNNKKKSPAMSVLLGILFVVVGFVIGYGVSSYLFTDESVDEGNKTEDKEENNKTEDKEENNKTEDKEDEKEDGTSVEKLTVDSPVVKKLFEIFREDTDVEMINVRANVNDSLESKRFIAFMQLSNDVKTNKLCSSLSTSHSSFDESPMYYVCGSNFDEINDNIISYWHENDGANIDKAVANHKTTTFLASDLEKKYREIFGKNAEYKNDSFSTYGYMEMAYYDKVNDLYAMFIYLVGGFEQEFSYVQTLESVEHVGTTLTLNTKLVISSVFDDDSIKEKNIVYTFEFEKETGNYIFVNRIEK